jgi:DNA-directed RNA polymerase subunit E'/Rpb7
MNRPKDNDEIYGVYVTELLTMKVFLSITEIGQTLKNNLERWISKNTEGRCIPEGFIKPKSVKVLKYSSGNVNGDKVEFQTVFECMVCHPVEGMLIECNVKTVTKAGVHAEVNDESGVVPIVVFVARDHHFTNKKFADIKENDKITVRVVGVRFELNDPYICVIAQLYNQNNANVNPRRQDE